jgi:hypothetical protein
MAQPVSRQPAVPVPWLLKSSEVRSVNSEAFWGNKEKNDIFSSVQLTVQAPLLCDNSNIKSSINFH